MERVRSSVDEPCCQRSIKNTKNEDPTPSPPCVAHAKAVNVDPERWNSQRDRIAAENKSVVEAALSAFDCVGELGAVLTKLDPDEPSAKLLAEFQKLPRYELKANG